MVAEQDLRVLQINAWDAGGGAASVAWNLFAGYRSRGYDSWMAVGQKFSDDSQVLRIPPRRNFYGPWSRFWAAVNAQLQDLDYLQGISGPLCRLCLGLAEPDRVIDYLRGIEDFNFPGTSQLLSLPPRRPTIVHAHNLHDGYFDLRALPSISQVSPVVLTLHDAWLLSGHCAHSLGCQRWKIGCGKCPDLKIPPAIRRDATRKNWLRKQEIFNKFRFRVATPSRWLMRKVEESMMLPAITDLRVIPNGVDLDIFRPAGRSGSRSALGLPQDAAILLFTASRMRENSWKDFATMRDALASAADQLPDRRVLLVVLGDEAAPERIGRADILYVPYQRSAKVVALYHQAADVYVHASRADTFPLAVLEAQACGRPVVASEVGGIPEQIEDGRTGFLVPVRDSAALANRIVALLSNEDLRRKMGAHAARFARRTFDLHRQVDTYLDWYREILTSEACTDESTAYAVSRTT